MYGSAGKEDKQAGAANCQPVAARQFPGKQGDVPGNHCSQNNPDSGSQKLSSVPCDGCTRRATDIDCGRTNGKYEVGGRVTRIVAEKTQTDENHQGQQPQGKNVVSKSLVVKHEVGAQGERRWGDDAFRRTGRQAETSPSEGFRSTQLYHSHMSGVTEIHAVRPRGATSRHRIAAAQIR